VELASRTSTERPARASSIAADNPWGPEPTTIASYRLMWKGYGSGVVRGGQCHSCGSLPFTRYFITTTACCPSAARFSSTCCNISMTCRGDRLSKPRIGLRYRWRNSAAVSSWPLTVGLCVERRPAEIPCGDETRIRDCPQLEGEQQDGNERPHSALPVQL
jgi:hypothetical protein